MPLAMAAGFSGGCHGDKETSFTAHAASICLIRIFGQRETCQPSIPFAPESVKLRLCLAVLRPCLDFQVLALHLRSLSVPRYDGICDAGPGGTAGQRATAVGAAALEDGRLGPGAARPHSSRATAVRGREWNH